MDKNERFKLYKEAVDKWGEESQINMLNEECGELIAAVAQFRRGRTSHHDVMTELADVFIMVEQITSMMGYDNFEKELDRKLLKLKEEKLKI